MEEREELKVCVKREKGHTEFSHKEMKKEMRTLKIFS